MDRRDLESGPRLRQDQSRLQALLWVIVGGESGNGARPMHADWVRSLRDQCADAGVSFFFKQWGGVRKNLTGRTLDGRTHHERPAGSEHRMAEKAVRNGQVQRLEVQVV